MNEFLELFLEDTHRHSFAVITGFSVSQLSDPPRRCREYVSICFSSTFRGRVNLFFDAFPSGS